MDGEVRADRAQQPHEAEVLHQHGIDAGFGEPHDMLLDRFELGGEDERVERDVAADAALVEKRHDLGQCVEMQIRGPGAGVESAFEAEVDRVGAVFDGGRDTQPVAGRGKQLQGAALAGRSFLRTFAAAFGRRRIDRSCHGMVDGRVAGGAKKARRQSILMPRTQSGNEAGSAVERTRGPAGPTGG